MGASRNVIKTCCSPFLGQLGRCRKKRCSTPKRRISSRKPISGHQMMSKKRKRCLGPPSVLPIARADSPQIPNATVPPELSWHRVMRKLDRPFATPAMQAHSRHSPSCRRSLALHLRGSRPDLLAQCFGAKGVASSKFGDNPKSKYLEPARPCRDLRSRFPHPIPSRSHSFSPKPAP